MTEFTPFSALLGGVFLGVAALLLLSFNGKIAGISGIVSLGIRERTAQGIWRWMFIFGLIIGPIISGFWDYSLPKQIDVTWSLIVVGGLFVGIGSALGNGCTSGHGICGIGRFSTRSIVATLVFMLVAVIVVFVVNHLVGAQL